MIFNNFHVLNTIEHDNNIGLKTNMTYLIN